MTDNRDFDAIKRDYNERFIGHHVMAHEARRHFRGKNILNDAILGFLRTKGGEVVEVGTGRFLNERFYGVTFSNQDGADDRSQCVSSLAEVATIIFVN